MKTITLPTTLGALSLALLLSGAVPATAAANNRNSPSGNSPSDNSAISQYIESVPTAGGGKPSGGVKSHRGGRPGGSAGSGALSPSTARAMSNSGTAGEQATAFATASAPSTAAGQPGTSSGSQRGGTHRPGATGLPRVGLGGQSTQTGSSSGNSPVSSVLSAFSGSSSSGGLGSWLPVLLIVILVGGTAIGLRHRYRRKST